MKIIETEIQGVYLIENYHAEDSRGNFIKTYHADFFRENHLCVDFKESYFSVSKKDVIRGMHLQLPPADHEKLVYVAKGEMLDVVLDMRKGSSTYGKSIKRLLSEKNHQSIYIPRGVAHGFKSLVDDTITVYNVSTVYNQAYDSGIRFDSFDFDWAIEKPILSDRDLNLVSFHEFDKQNPF